MTIPKILTIAGSDSSGAAGLQADLKAIAARGGYGMTAVTVITAQNSLGVQKFYPLSPEWVSEQIDSVLSDVGADVVKTGMLLSAPVIELVAAKVKQYHIDRLIVDPVMVAGDSRRIIDPEADTAYIQKLFPLAMLITPNLDEVRLLTGRAVTTPGDMYIAAEMLLGMGPRFVLIKGGHAPDGDEVVDILYDGANFHEFRAPRVDVQNARGTGCTFASAIATEVAKGHTVKEAVETAKTFVTAALKAGRALNVGAGRGTLWQGV